LNDVVPLILPQKQESSNKVIRKSSVAALFCVSFEELKAINVKVALCCDFKESHCLDETERMQDT
jgi:hypothetical protein